MKDEAAPIVKEMNLKQIHQVVKIYYQEEASLPGMGANGPVGDSVQCWRVVIAELLSGNRSHEMPVQFRIPTTCSHAPGSKTNVFLVLEDAASKKDAASESTTWEEYVKSHGGRPLLLMIDQVCVPWQTNGILFTGNDVDGLQEQSQVIILSALPHHVRKMTGTVVTVDGRLVYVEHIDALLKWDATSKMTIDE